ncbi:Thoeris anti-defense Tad2 family protein [Xenorhabdus cabanillasii]|uniref:Uncharacterized protein n=1 Tax=Xenorhabdus cabanillasii JM26 TaxID=1427517 RepID=W1ISL5_9GAMM|nr:MW1434 family type I TA system toxin [Xenorhabdus cabanillasii]PHM77489.1 hypothetical protein Xcab_01896 [Xenorhabdus cabanillasii JM26]CDL81409.1 conserved hypothetical protein [Xenorhabdus cabanillasii JM26]
MSELVTKEGTYAWALLQLHAGKRVSRRDWANQDVYLLRNPGFVGHVVKDGDYHARAGVEIGTRFNYLAYIELHTASDGFVPWTASQIDIEAHDWAIITQFPETSDDSEYKLVLDVTPYTWYRIDGYEQWVVRSDKLAVVENNMGDYPVSSITWADYFSEFKPNDFNIDFSNASLDSRESLKKVTNKKLTITVNNVEYPLGYRIKASDYNSPQYVGENANKIGKMLKTNGQAFRFHFKWHD